VARSSRSVADVRRLRPCEREAPMNEVQLIRRELTGQRVRAREFIAAFESGDSINATVSSECYASYLMFAIESESARIVSHLERLTHRSDLSEAERRRLEHCGREFGSVTAAQRAAAAAFTRETIARDVELLTRLSTLVEELEAVAESRYGVDDWRCTAHVDADSILEERRLHKRISSRTDGSRAV